jgi:hypothetical protein
MRYPQAQTEISNYKEQEMHFQFKISKCQCGLISHSCCEPSVNIHLMHLPGCGRDVLFLIITFVVEIIVNKIIVVNIVNIVIIIVIIIVIMIVIISVVT